MKSATSVLYSRSPNAFRLIVLCNGNNRAEFLCGAKIEECHFINALCPHPSTQRAPLTSEKAEVFTECCISHGWLVMSNTFNSDITQHQMFVTEKQRAFRTVGRRFTLYDNDSRDIKVCWLFLMPGFNTGLCQCSSPKTSFKDSELREGEKKRERSSGFTAAGPAQS